MGSIQNGGAAGMLPLRLPRPFDGMKSEGGSPRSWIRNQVLTHGFFKSFFFCLVPHLGGGAAAAGKAGHGGMRQVAVFVDCSLLGAPFSTSTITLP